MSPSGRETGDDGWPAGLIELYRSERLRLVRLAYLLTGRQEVAEEMVQEAFIATRRAWPEVRRPGQYVQRAVVNRCRSWGRHQQVVRTHPPAPPEPSQLEPDELWDALSQLNDRRRAAIVLRYYIGLTHREIAGILDCQPATVRTSIHRGLKQLSREIER